MPMQAWFPDETPSVAPGDNLRLVLTVENPTPHPDTFTITPSGINVSWVTVSEPSLTLEGGASSSIDVWVHPPRVASTAAGRHEVSVRIVAESDPSVSLTSDAVILVEPFDDRTITVLQPIRRGHRGAAFDIVVRNDGNAMANCRMRLIDASHRVEGSFDPPTVGVGPGSASTVRLKARAAGGWFRRSERVLPFEIVADESGHVSDTTTASVLQTATLSADGVGRTVATLVVVGAIVAGWLLVARGWIDRRIDDAVNERIAAVQVDNRGDVTQIVPAPQINSPAGAPDESGEPTLVRLAPEVAAGETGTDGFAVPADSTLFVTDIVVQNPARDDARAVLSVGEETIYEWDLADAGAINEFQPRITPLPVSAPDQLTFTVVCESVGNPDAAGCTAAVLLTGRLTGND